MGRGVHPFEDVGRVPVTGYGLRGLREDNRGAPSRETGTLVAGVRGNVRSEQTWGAVGRTYVLWEEGTGGRGVGKWELFVC